MRISRSTIIGISLPLLLSAVIASAQTNTSGCPTDADVRAKIAACKEDGMDYRVEYDQNKCRWVRCVPMPASDVVCPSSAELERMMAACKEKGMSYETVERDGCKWVQCKETTPTCPSDEQNRLAAERCKNVGGTAVETWDDRQCKWVKCDTGSTNTCPSEEDNRIKAARCKESGGTVVEKWDDRKCLWIACEPGTTESVACKKRGCTVACEDGTTYNVCNDGARCGVQSTDTGSAERTCRTMKIGKCRITRCTDGTVKRECPKTTNR